VKTRRSVVNNYVNVVYLCCKITFATRRFKLCRPILDWQRRQSARKFTQGFSVVFHSVVECSPSRPNLVPLDRLVVNIHLNGRSLARDREYVRVTERHPPVNRRSGKISTATDDVIKKGSVYVREIANSLKRANFRQRPANILYIEKKPNPNTPGINLSVIEPNIKSIWQINICICITLRQKELTLSCHPTHKKKKKPKCLKKRKKYKNKEDPRPRTSSGQRPRRENRRPP
jgi:hypothetical protein